MCCRFLLTGRVTLTEKSDHLNYLNTASTRLHSKPNVIPSESLCLAMTYILRESKHTKLQFLFCLDLEWLYDFSFWNPSNQYLYAGYTNPGQQVTTATKFRTVVPNVSPSRAKNMCSPPSVIRMLVAHIGVELCEYSVLSTQWTHGISIVKINWLLTFHRNKPFYYWIQTLFGQHDRFYF